MHKVSPGKLPAVGLLLALLAVLALACGAEATEAPLPDATEILSATLVSTPSPSFTAAEAPESALVSRIK